MSWEHLVVVEGKEMLTDTHTHTMGDIKGAQ